MATISERLAYLLTFDTKSGVKSLEQFGKKAEDELGKAEKSQEKLNATMAKAGAAALAFAGVAGVGLFKMAQGANNAQQNMEALEQVVGDLEARKLGEWAEGSAEGVGLASQRAVEAVTSFAQLGKMAGVTGQDLNQFSTGLVQMAADFAAFKNVTPEKALQDIRSGFSGSVEVMRKYGIFLDDLTLKAAYFRETGQKVTGVLTGQQKVIAVNSELYRQGADMLGQWGRESDQLQGRTAVLQANMQNLSDNIGAGVLPVVTGMIGGLAALAGGMASMDESTGHFVGTAALLIVALSGAVGGVLLLRAGIISLRATLASLGTAGWAAVGVVAALTVAAVAGAAIYEEYAGAKRRAKERTDEMVAALKAEKAGHEAATAEIILARVATEEMDAIQQTLGLRTAELTNFVRGGLSPAVEKLVDDFQKAGREGGYFNGGLEAQARQLGLTKNEYIQFVGELISSRDAWVAANAEMDLAERKSREAAQEIRGLSGSYALVTGSIEAAVAAQKALDAENAPARLAEQKEAADKAAESTKLWAKQLERAADASQDAVDATRDLMDAQLDAVRQTFNLRKSTVEADIAYEDFTAALAENEKVQKDGSKTDQEKKRSQDELTLSAWSTAESVIAVAEAHAEEMGASDDAQASASAQIATLIQLREQYPFLRSQIDEYIAKLKEIPGSVPTNIQVLIDQGDLERAEYLLNLLTRQRTATVTVLTAGGVRAADARAGVPAAEPPTQSTPSSSSVPNNAAFTAANSYTINVNGALLGTPTDLFEQADQYIERSRAGEA